MKVIIYIIRGIAIFCVVCAHMQWIPEEVPELSMGLQITNSGLKLLGMLGVPAFYIVAGYCFMAYGNCWELLWHKRTIIISWLVAGSIHYIVKSVHSASDLAVNNWLHYIFGSIYWYVPTLLVIFVLVNCFIKVFGNRPCFDTLTKIIIIIGFALNFVMAVLSRGSTYSYGLNPAWWSLFLLGMVWRKKRVFPRLSVTKKICLPIVCLVMSILFIITHAAKGYCAITTIPIFVVGLMGFWLLGEFINRSSRKECFIKVGKASYFIYLYHLFPVGMMELVKDGYNGYIVEHNNVEALKRGIFELMEAEEQWEEYAENALQVMRGYTIEKMVEAHMKSWR